MYCTSCGKKVGNATFCPHCGAAVQKATVRPAQNAKIYTSMNQPGTVIRPGKQKLPLWALILSIAACTVIAIFILIVLFSPSDSQSNQGVQSGESSTGSTYIVTEPIEEKRIFGINEPGTTSSAKITVTNVEITSGKNYSTPQTGNEYVIVTVKYENIGEVTSLSYNPYDFKLKNSQGQIVSPAITLVSSDTDLSSGSLIPGGTVQGTIPFEAPVGDKDLVLQYLPLSSLGIAALEFKLN